MNINSPLPTYRKEIDRIDAELLTLLRSRFHLCRDIAMEKKKGGKPIEDAERERELLARAQEILDDKNEVASAVLETYVVLIERSRTFQENFIANRG